MSHIACHKTGNGEPRPRMPASAYCMLFSEAPIAGMPRQRHGLGQFLESYVINRVLINRVLTTRLVQPVIRLGVRQPRKKERKKERKLFSVTVGMCATVRKLLGSLVTKSRSKFPSQKQTGKLNNSFFSLFSSTVNPEKDTHYSHSVTLSCPDRDSHQSRFGLTVPVT